MTLCAAGDDETTTEETLGTGEREGIVSDEMSNVRVRVIGSSS